MRGIVQAVWRRAIVRHVPVFGMGANGTRSASLFGLAVHTDFAAHDLYQLPANGEPQACAAIAAAGGAVPLLEVVEQVGELLGADADAGVADFEIHVVAVVRIPVRRTVMVPLSVNFTALLIRLTRIWRSRTGSPMQRSTQVVCHVECQGVGVDVCLVLEQGQGFIDQLNRLKLVCSMGILPASMRE